jgi:hypothetical protein
VLTRWNEIPAADPELAFQGFAKGQRIKIAQGRCFRVVGRARSEALHCLTLQRESSERGRSNCRRRRASRREW